jgi:hypothetical protein
MQPGAPYIAGQSSRALYCSDCRYFSGSLNSSIHLWQLMKSTFSIRLWRVRPSTGTVVRKELAKAFLGERFPTVTDMKRAANWRSCWNLSTKHLSADHESMFTLPSTREQVRKLPLLVSLLWSQRNSNASTRFHEKRFQVIIMCCDYVHVRFGAFTLVTMKNAVFWDVTPCDSCKNRCFGRAYYLHHQGGKIRRARNNLSSN